MAEADRSAVRARRVQMGRIVGLDDDEVIVRPEQRGRDDEQRARCTAGNQHIVDAEPRRISENQLAQPLTAAMIAIKKGEVGRSEERRVGKECVSTCRSRWGQDNEKKKRRGTTNSK